MERAPREKFAVKAHAQRIIAATKTLIPSQLF